MKIKDMIEHLSKLNPNDQICVVWWERPEREDVGGYVSHEAWQRVCQEFDDYVAFDGYDLNDWMQSAITDYMEMEDK